MVKKKTEIHRSVSKGTKANSEVLEKGTPNDHHVKQMMSPNFVGANLGVTKNMDNYESLRVDVWGVEEVLDGESKKDAFTRLMNTLSTELQDIISEYTED